MQLFSNLLTKTINIVLQSSFVFRIGYFAINGILSLEANLLSGICNELILIT